jgi:hypothetical protein
VEEKKLINRLWIGHKRLTFKFLMTKEVPQCITCEVILTVKHITECYKYNNDLEEYNISPNMDEALDLTLNTSQIC